MCELRQSKTLERLYQKRDAIEAFHRHLGTWRHCDNNPFNLCAAGMELIEKAAASIGLTVEVG